VWTVRHRKRPKAHIQGQQDKLDILEKAGYGYDRINLMQIVIPGLIEAFGINDTMFGLGWNIDQI
jgi:hypothetical protein